MTRCDDVVAFPKFHPFSFRLSSTRSSALRRSSGQASDRTTATTAVVGRIDNSPMVGADRNTIPPDKNFSLKPETVFVGAHRHAPVHGGRRNHLHGLCQLHRNQVLPIRADVRPPLPTGRTLSIRQAGLQERSGFDRPFRSTPAFSITTFSDGAHARNNNRVTWTPSPNPRNYFTSPALSESQFSMGRVEGTTLPSKVCL